MKKILSFALLVVFALGIIICFSGCGNKDIMDTAYHFDRAIIKLQNGKIVEGKVDSWRDYDDGDQLQIVINGTKYLVHSANATLIAE